MEFVEEVLLAFVDEGCFVEKWELLGGGIEFGDDLLGLCKNGLKLTDVQPIDWVFVLLSQV